MQVNQSNKLNTQQSAESVNLRTYFLKTYFQIIHIVPPMNSLSLLKKHISIKRIPSNRKTRYLPFLGSFYPKTRRELNTL